jgi:hypothetical protein
VKTKALYGFDPELEPFSGTQPAAQADLLRAWGCTAVFGGYEDPQFVQAAHAAGLKVYAEFACFVHKAWWDAFPDSRPVEHSGQPLEPEGWYYGVNPSHPAARKELFSRLEVLLSRHEIDGVWLDFIRWPCRWEGAKPYLPRTSFDPGTLQRFWNDTGLPVKCDDAVTAAEQLRTRYRGTWARWRCQQITDWVAQARKIVRRTRPDALLGLFGVPWRRSDLSGAILRVIGQDFAALASYVDIFSPMVYHAMCDQSTAWITDVTSHVQGLTERPVWPIIQAVDHPRPLTAEEYAAALDAALAHPASDGVVVFTLKGVLQSGRLSVTVDRFHRPIPDP